MRMQSGAWEEAFLQLRPGPAEMSRKSSARADHFSLVAEAAESVVEADIERVSV
jgi:hypothetical protein